MNLLCSPPPSPFPDHQSSFVSPASQVEPGNRSIQNIGRNMDLMEEGMGRSVIVGCSSAFYSLYVTVLYFEKRKGENLFISLVDFVRVKLRIL